MTANRIHTLFYVFIAFAMHSLCPHPALHAADPQAVTFDQLLSYIHLEVKEEKLLKMLAESPTTFTLGEEQIATLTAAGASERVLSAIRRPASGRLEQSSDIRDFVIILDASASMKDASEPGKTKWDLSKQAATDLVLSVPNGRRLAFIVYGHDFSKRCQSIEALHSLSAIDDNSKTALIRQISAITPSADTPIGASLALARSMITGTNELTKVILITDGMESCKGDPVGEATQLAAMTHLQGGVDVIGFGLNPLEVAEVEKIARSGRGKFYDAQNATTLRESVAAVESTLTSTRAADEPQKQEDLSKFYAVIDRVYDTYDPGLQIEPMINGQSIGVFSSDAVQRIGHLLMTGENTIAFRSSSLIDAGEGNPMKVLIGPGTLAADGRSVNLDRVLWQYCNGTDWTYVPGDKKYVHKMNPSATDATVTAKLFISSLECDRPIGHGDYVVEGKYKYETYWPPFTATLFVNGTPITSFCDSSRTVVINSLLRLGNNEIRIVSRGIQNSLAEDNSMEVTLGKSKFVPSNNTYVMMPIQSKRAEQGLTRNDDNEFVNADNPSADFVEQRISFNVDKLPSTPH